MFALPLVLFTSSVDTILLVLSHPTGRPVWLFRKGGHFARYAVVLKKRSQTCWCEFRRWILVNLQVPRRYFRYEVKAVCTGRGSDPVPQTDDDKGVAWGP